MTDGQKKNRKNLRAQIMHGFKRVILFLCILGALNIGFLVGLYTEYQSINQMENVRLQIQQVLSAHYSWRIQLSDSLQTGAAFEGSLDPDACSLGQWIQANESEIQGNSQLSSLVEQVRTPHEEMHANAANIQQLRETDLAAATQMYIQEVAPFTEQVIQGLQQIDTYYSQQLQSAQGTYQALMIVILLLIVIITAGIAAFSVWYATHLASQISRPVVRMAQWADRLALGMVESEADAEFLQMQEQNKDNEVGTMMRAFQKMAANVENNVKVLEQVAKGDMTTFVHIRSREDSLGKSLYHLVQSNDAVFNEIVEVAHTVASGANEIASVSHTLAESATEQADAVHQLSDTIAHTRNLIQQNDEGTQYAKQITEKIRQDTQVSNQQMRQLVDDVMKIHAASQRISAVMKSINDIAFETNILALNAAIEAARAGSAGKGFAVVAEEVRALAMKSTEAAKESRELIQGTIDQAAKGSTIATQSMAVFDEIQEDISKIVEIVDRISAFSGEQMEGIASVSQQIDQITQAATNNAAISEQSDAASHNMSEQADVLRQTMQKFKLRHRLPGQAFIPEEKKSDADFIKAANEAYHQTEQTGRFGREYIDPDEQKY